MGKGNSSGRGVSGSTPTDMVRALERQGFSGSIPQSGLRPESFAHLKSGGIVHGGSPILTIHPDKTVHITDGRHRITLARERGESSIVARVHVLGPRGGTKLYKERKIPLKQDSGGIQKLR